MASSCPGNKKFLTAEASTKAAMRTERAIDEFLNIINVKKFRELNTQWSNNAKERFNIEEPLFMEDTVGGKLKAVPNKRIFKAIDNAKGIYYQLDDSEEVPVSKASTATVVAVKRAMEKMGISFTSLEEYARKNPEVNVKGVNGLADLVQKVVAIAHNMENVAITEETVHIATAMIEQVNPKVMTEFMSKIDRFKIYKTVLDSYKKRKDYQTRDGRPDIRKIKKEAVDKLIAEVIINQSENTTEFPELLEETNKSWVETIWNMIKDLIKGVYRKSNIDIFERVAGRIAEGEVERVNIEEGGIFAQVKNDLVDAYYNTIKSWAARLNVVEEDLQKGTPRYYTLDGQGKISTVTQKVKRKQKFATRTEDQKAIDDMKKQWGTEGHNFIMNYIKVNLIDKDGYVRERFGTADIDTPLNSAITEKLGKFAQELVRSFRSGTRILVEERIINTRVKGCWLHVRLQGYRTYSRWKRYKDTYSGLEVHGYK